MPARICSLPASQRDWLIEFLRRFSANCQERLELVPETFLLAKTVRPGAPLHEAFMESSFEMNPILGLSREPGSSPPPLPTGEERKQMADGKKNFAIDDYVSDYCYWFLNKDDAEVRRRFLGAGGLTTLFRKPAPEAAPLLIVPPSLPQMNPHDFIPKFLSGHPQLGPLVSGFRTDGSFPMPAIIADHPAMKSVFSTLGGHSMAQRGHALADGFRARTKEVFGSGLPQDMAFKGLPFVIPRLSSQTFFGVSGETVREWFSVFDVYLAESPADEGLVLASLHDLHPVLAAIIADMRAASYVYWEG
jgi:hypothetical protein